MTKVFIDGSAGTTGLRINERLAARKDIEIISLTEETRKDPAAKKEAMSKADVTFLCLPDAAAIESAALADGTDTIVIDTSTAHRVNDNWTYGFPELTGQYEKIKNSKKIANPGCHASGFISLVAPLVENGIIPGDALLTAYSLTGYSGGGKKMIADYDNTDRDKQLDSPGMYGLTQMHKHLPEMSKICGLNNNPVFCPVVAPYYSGMEVTVPLFASQIDGNIDTIKELYKSYYSKGLIRYAENSDAFLYANKLQYFDNMEITVCGNSDRILLVSRFDNLGKGASGAAIQNMNIVIGADETTGLDIYKEN